MGFEPGHYLTFQLDTPTHGPLVRNYSISSAPGRDRYRISVKREEPPADGGHLPPGLASTFLHDHVGPGAASGSAHPPASSSSKSATTARSCC
jgi:ferredoxin-NADP reductase